eukprot:gene22272-30514_t
MESADSNQLHQPLEEYVDTPIATFSTESPTLKSHTKPSTEGTYETLTPSTSPIKSNPSNSDISPRVTIVPSSGSMWVDTSDNPISIHPITPKPISITTMHPTVTGTPVSMHPTIVSILPATPSISKYPTATTLFPTPVSTVQDSSKLLSSPIPTSTTSMANTLSQSKGPTLNNEGTSTIVPSSNSNRHPMHSYGNEPPTQTPHTTNQPSSELPSLKPTSPATASPTKNSDNGYYYHPTTLYRSPSPSPTSYPTTHRSSNHSSILKPTSATTTNPNANTNEHPTNSYGNYHPTLYPHTSNHPSSNQTTFKSPANTNSHTLHPTPNLVPTLISLSSYHPTLNSPQSRDPNQSTQPLTRQPYATISISQRPSNLNSTTHTYTPTRTPTRMPTHALNSSISIHPTQANPHSPHNYGNEAPTIRPLTWQPSVYPIYTTPLVPHQQYSEDPTCTSLNPDNSSSNIYPTTEPTYTSTNTPELHSNRTSTSTSTSILIPSYSPTIFSGPPTHPQSVDTEFPAILNPTLGNIYSSGTPLRYPSIVSTELPSYRDLYTNRTQITAPSISSSKDSSPSPSLMSFPVPVIVIVVNSMRPSKLQPLESSPPSPASQIAVPISVSTIAPTTVALPIPIPIPSTYLPTIVQSSLTTRSPIETIVSRYHVTTRFQFFMRNISSTSVFPDSQDQKIVLQALAIGILGFNTLDFTTMNTIKLVNNRSSATISYRRLRSLEVPVLQSIRPSDLFAVTVTVNYSTHSNISRFSNVNSFTSHSLKQYLNSSIKNGMFQRYTRSESTAQGASSLAWVDYCLTANCSAKASSSNSATTTDSSFGNAMMHCSQIQSSAEWNRVYGYSNDTIITAYFIWLLCLLVTWILVLFWSVYLLLSKYLLPTERDPSVAILNTVRMRQSQISIIISLDRILFFSMVIYMTFKLKVGSFACVEFFLQTDFWDPYLNLVEAVLYPLLLIVVTLRQERYHLLIDSSVLEFAGNQKRMLLRIARMRIVLAIFSACFIVYGVIITIRYSVPHRSSNETTERALMTYTLVGLYSFSAAILCMKLLYPSIVIGTIHDSILAKESKHPSVGHGQRFNSTVEDTYTRLPTIYSNTSDDVDTIVIIGGEVIDLEEEEENAFDNFDSKGDPLEERKSTESSAALQHTFTRTTRNRHQNPNTVNFQLDSPLGDRTEENKEEGMEDAIRTAGNLPSPEDEQTVVHPYANRVATNTEPRTTSDLSKHEIQFKENIYVVTVTLVLPVLIIISTALFKISDPITVLILNSVVVYALQLCFVVLCTSTSISIIGSEIIARSVASNRTANRDHHAISNNRSRESLASSSTPLPSYRRDNAAHYDSWSVERLFERHSDNDEPYNNNNNNNRNLENSLQELNDLRNTYTATTGGYRKYSREEHWNSITRSRSSSSGGILQHNTGTATVRRSPSYVMASRHYPHSESGWLVMWLSRSGGDPTYSIHDENQRISTV